MTTTTNKLDYKVKDLSLATWGRKEIELAEVEMPGPAFIPEDYVPEVSERLYIYKRLSSARTVEEVHEVMGTLEDRFGELPLEALALGRLHEVKARCRLLGISRCDFLKVRILLEFGELTVVEPARLVELLGQHKSRMSLRSDTLLEMRFSPEEAGQPFALLHWLFRQLEG